MDESVPTGPGLVHQPSLALRASYGWQAVSVPAARAAVPERRLSAAEQFPTARDRNRLGPRTPMINELHGAPLERES